MKQFEEFHDIQTPDNKKILGILASPTGEVALKPLIIFSHGIGTTISNVLLGNAAYYFENEGYNTYRFGYYHWAQGYRKLQECTQSLHVQDLETITEHFQEQGVNDITVIGHSFGGITPFLSRKIGAATSGMRVVGWDPSHPQSSLFEGAPPYEGNPDLTFFEGTFNAVVRQDMVTEFKGLDMSKEVADFRPPSLIISAGGGTLQKAHMSLQEDLGDNSTHHTIANADHGFFLTRTQDELFSQTAAWLHAYS